MWANTADVDAWFPGMVFAAVRKGPRRMRVVEYEGLDGARAVVPVAGVEHYRRGECDSLAVVASNTWQAMRLAERADIVWGPAAVDGEFAGERLDNFTCTAHFQGRQLEMWVPVRAARWMTELGAEIAGLPETAVHLHTPLLSVGLPRQVIRDCVAQAIQIAMAVPEVPVKVSWLQGEGEDTEPFPDSSVRPVGMVPTAKRGGIALVPRLIGRASKGRPRRY